MHVTYNLFLDDSASLTSPEQFVAPSFVPLGDTSKTFPTPVSSMPASTFPITSQKTESNITFYDFDPKSSPSVMLPPLVSPPSSSQAPSAATPGVQGLFSPVHERFVTFFSIIHYSRF